MNIVRSILAVFFSLLSLSEAHWVHAEIIVFGSGTNEFSMEFVPIGNPGNAPDTTGNPNPAGAVGYHYNMGKFEVSRDMVTKANQAGSLGITMADMTSFGGNGTNRPATGVSWNEAARFVNWLNTSNGYAPAYKFAFQPGDVGYSSNANIQLWQAGDLGFDPANLFRNSQANFFLPSMDEWYKAAYYDPSANGGTGGYWNFPTGSDNVPIAVSGGTIGGTAVFSTETNGQSGPADIDNAGGLSPYGVMGLGGNVWEWEESSFDLQNNDPASRRGGKGGNWGNFSINLSVITRDDVPPTVGDFGYGFRVASVPEPSSALLMTLACCGLLQRRTRSI